MRWWTAVAALVAVVVLTGGCGERTPAADPSGRLYIATGNTTGVYYQLGGGYADLISKHMPGWKATAEATGASVENIQRVVRGDADVAFTLADAAGDAVRGGGAFASPQPIRALARIYANYTHVIARAGIGISSVADLKGRTVSTGGPNSGTENIALRLLRAAGLDPTRDLTTLSLTLPDTVQAMKDATIDALFWSGGVPTGGITDLVAALKGRIVFISVDGLLPGLQAEFGPVYQPVTLPGDAYKVGLDVRTIAVPNLLVVRDTMPDALAHDLTKVLFEFLPELGKVHPEGRNILLTNGPGTEPVTLHPGAAAFYRGG
jgi:TRAP transporter TAXI family solute receptor